MPARIPIPPHLGGGFVDDPGPLDAAQRQLRGQRIGLRRLRPRMFASLAIESGALEPGFADPWEAHEIEECARFARINRDD